MINDKKSRGKYVILIYVTNVPLLMARDFAASSIGRYPVHRHKLPSKHSSISSTVEEGLDRNCA